MSEAGHILGQRKDEQCRQCRKRRFKALLEISRTLRRYEIPLLLGETLDPDCQRVHGCIGDPQFSDAGQKLQNEAFQPSLQVKALPFIRQSGQTNRHHDCNSQRRERGCKHAEPGIEGQHHGKTEDAGHQRQKSANRAAGDDRADGFDTKRAVREVANGKVAEKRGRHAQETVDNRYLQ